MRATCAADLHDLVDRRDIGRIVDRSRPVEREVSRDVVEQLRRVGLQRLARVDQRRQFLVFDGDQFGGIEGRGMAFRHHHRDRFADMHDLFLGQRGAMRERDLGAAAARRSADAAYTEPMPVMSAAVRMPITPFGLRGRLGRNRDDAGMRVRRANEHGMADALLFDVVHEFAAAADEGVVLDTGAVVMIV